MDDFRGQKAEEMGKEGSFRRFICPHKAVAVFSCMRRRMMK